MRWYIVEETVLYRVRATSDDEAIQHVIDDGERDKHCFRGVDERAAYVDDEQ